MVGRGGGRGVVAFGEDGLFEGGDGGAGGAVEVEGEEAGVGWRGVLEDGGPDGEAVGVGEGEPFEVAFGEPLEGAFVEGGGDVGGVDGGDDAEPEHEPVVWEVVWFGLVCGFADDAEEVEVVCGESEADFFVYFADGAGGWRFAEALFELAADG